MKTADIPPAGGKRDRIGCDYTLFRRLSGIYAYTINLAGYCCGSNAAGGYSELTNRYSVARLSSRENDSTKVT
ncbi:hypothetical protein FKR61_25440, partial [Salmonella enterica subsp. enterica]|nr:hypothetical protein [Salmonella enterica subsp. enterica]